MIKPSELTDAPVMSFTRQIGCFLCFIALFYWNIGYAQAAAHYSELVLLSLMAKLNYMIKIWSDCYKFCPLSLNAYINLI